MKVMALDQNHDWVFGQFKENQDAVLQNIQTRLLQLKNDCFFDLDSGIDWFGLDRTSVFFSQECKKIILGTEGVLELTAFETKTVNKLFTISCTVRTIFSPHVTKTINFSYGNI